MQLILVKGQKVDHAFLPEGVHIEDQPNPGPRAEFKIECQIDPIMEVSL